MVAVTGSTSVGNARKSKPRWAQGIPGGSACQGTWKGTRLAQLDSVDRGTLSKRGMGMRVNAVVVSAGL